MSPLRRMFEHICRKQQGACARGSGDQWPCLLPWYLQTTGAVRSEEGPFCQTIKTMPGMSPCAPNVCLTSDIDSVVKLGLDGAGLGVSFEMLRYVYAGAYGRKLFARIVTAQVRPFPAADHCKRLSRAASGPHVPIAAKLASYQQAQGNSKHAGMKTSRASSARCSAAR